MSAEDWKKVTSDERRFSLAVERIVTYTDAYESKAFYFVKDAVERAISLFRRQSSAAEVPGKIEITPQFIAETIIQEARNYFGETAVYVLEKWGIHTCHDLGRIIYYLAKERVLLLDVSTENEFDNLIDLKAALKGPLSNEVPLPGNLPSLDA